MQMGTSTLVNRRLVNAQDKAPLPLAHRPNLRGTNTLAISRTANPTDKAHIPMPMGTNTPVNGKAVNATDKAHLPWQMGEFRKVYGRIINFAMLTKAIHLQLPEVHHSP